ncbi:MAG: hypothetical protein KDK39_19535 [Leptospiraceae bacterium]|nr:hypothetical protein [Leptospiraceae bacterium]
MKTLIWTLLAVLSPLTLWAQNSPALDYNRTAEESPVFVDRENPAARHTNTNPISDDTNFFFNSDNQPMLDEPELLAQNSTTTPADRNSGLDGFAESKWQSSFSQVRTRLASLAKSDTSTEKVEIVAMEANKYILVKRNDILYRYNFYRTPYEVALLNDHELKKEDHDQKEALLYHVKIIMPFIDSSQVKDKLVKTHGPNTRTTVDQKKQDGALVWELDSGLIFQWYEPYHEQAFTRTIDFISTAMAQKIMGEYKTYFDAPERLLLQKLLLK